MPRALGEHSESISQATPEFSMTFPSQSIAFCPSIWWRSDFKHENPIFGVISARLTPEARRKIDTSSFFTFLPPQWVNLRWSPSSKWVLLFWAEFVKGQQIVCFAMNFSWKKAPDPCSLRIINLHRKWKYQKSKNMATCGIGMVRWPCFSKCKFFFIFPYLWFSMEKMFFSKNHKVEKSNDFN